MTNDKKLKSLAEGNILCNQTTLVEALLEHFPQLFEEIENLYYRFEPEKESTTCMGCVDEYDSIDRNTGLCRDCFEAENTAKEIFEWHLVSQYLADELVRQGETVFHQYGCHWWGRACTGQAIYLDSVFQDIARKCGVIV